jgi:hypothetical protein
MGSNGKFNRRKLKALKKRDIRRPEIAAGVHDQADDFSMGREKRVFIFSRKKV